MGLRLRELRREKNHGDDFGKLGDQILKMITPLFFVTIFIAQQNPFSI